MIKDDAPVLERIEKRIGMDHDKLDENLSWLKAQMHRYFFRFNEEDADAYCLNQEAGFRRAWRSW